MPQVLTQIEIAAPPEKVREVLLNFPLMSQWLHGPGITGVQVKDTANNNTSQPSGGENLKPGDIVIGHLGPKTTFEATVLTNTPSQLSWLGSLPYIFSGEHVFSFLPGDDKTAAGGTTTTTIFTNTETFSGLFAVFTGQWAMGASIQKGFEALNKDLKRRVEELNPPS